MLRFAQHNNAGEYRVTMPSEISIITPWLDHSEFIADYEQAVGAPGVEVIVVDNGSADANAALLRQMIGRLGGKYIRNEENRWFSGANNQGLAAATGQIVVFLNNDIAGDPEWLQGVRTDVKPGALYGLSVRQVQAEGKTLQHLEGWCLAAVREAFNQLGGWDAKAFAMPYWEDADLCMRAVSIGLKLICAQWPLTHKKNGTSGFVPAVMHSFARNRDVFNARLNGKPMPSDIPLREPEDLARVGRLTEAEQQLRKALERDPDNASLLLDYGRILNLSGRFEASLLALRRAVELNPSEPLAYNALGTLYIQTKKPQEAVATFARMTELIPNSAEAFANLSIALFGCARFAEAAQAAQRSVQLNPSLLFGQVALSNALRELGKLDEALAAARAAQEKYPNAAQSNLVLGMALKQLGKRQDARAALERALAIEPHNGIAVREHRELLEEMKASSPPA